MKHVSTTKRAAHTHHCKDNSKDLAQTTHLEFCQPHIQIPHWTTKCVSIGVFGTVHLSQRTFCKLGGHTQETGNHHPKDGTWTTDRHCYGYTCNISKTDCGRQCRGQRLKMRNLTFLLFVIKISSYDLNCMTKSTNRDESHSKRKVNRSQNQPNHNCWQ